MHDYRSRLAPLLFMSIGFMVAPAPADPVGVGDLGVVANQYSQAVAVVDARYACQQTNLWVACGKCFDKVAERLKRKGDLRGYLALEQARKEHDAGGIPSQPVVTNDHPEVAKVLESYQAALMVEAVERARQLVAIQVRYLSLLDNQMKRLTMRNKIDEAKGVAAMIAAVQQQKDALAAFLKTAAVASAVRDKADGGAPASSATQAALPVARAAMGRDPPAGTTIIIPLTNGVGIEMIWCPPGKYKMGSPEDEPERGRSETQHGVTLTKGFWLGKFEVTKRQYEAVVPGRQSSSPTNDNLPAMRRGREWQPFLANLNALVPGGGFRPPTEAEWEYACRAGTTTPYAGKLEDMGWYKSNSEGVSHPVGQKMPNAWGFHDMHGNAWEACSDFTSDVGIHDLPAGRVTDPTGPASGPRFIVRGGGLGLGDTAQSCRSAARRDGDVSWLYIGLRVARSASP